MLFVEVMGATTTLLYGVNLLMLPVYDPIPIEEGSVPEVAKVAHHYHIRVLVPCYRESLELVQRTVTAALGAQLPTNCRRWASFPSVGGFGGGGGGPRHAEAILRYWVKRWL